MPDELCSALLKDSGLRVLAAVATDTAREARGLHQAQEASAQVLAQALCAGALMAALQKSRSRMSLQLECDGPLRGLFVDADADGALRGYLKNPHLAVVGAQGAFRWRPLMGNKGYVSVLRELKEGEHYRSSVELTHFDPARDLEHFLETSDQLPSALFLETLAQGAEPLGFVTGLLIQPLPDGDRKAMDALAAPLRAHGLSAALGKSGGSPLALLKLLFDRPDFEVMSRYPLCFRCTCSLDRVNRALLTMGRQELLDVIEKDKKAEVTCEFCARHYEVDEAGLRALLAGAGG